MKRMIPRLSKSNREVGLLSGADMCLGTISPNGRHYWQLDCHDKGICRYCGAQKQFGGVDAVSEWEVLMMLVVISDDDV